MKNSTGLEFAKKTLSRMRKYPAMFATNRETFVAIVVTMLEMLGYRDPFIYTKFHDTEGCKYLNLEKEIDREFADRTIDTAEQIINYEI